MQRVWTYLKKYSRKILTIKTGSAAKIIFKRLRFKSIHIDIPETWTNHIFRWFKIRVILWLWKYSHLSLSLKLKPYSLCTTDIHITQLHIHWYNSGTNLIYFAVDFFHVENNLNHVLLPFDLKLYWQIWISV